MAKPHTPPQNDARSLSLERFQRLHNLLHLLGKRPQTRVVLLRQMGIDLRKFYRDLQLLRQAGIEVILEDGRYRLEDDLSAALKRLPFPDPHLTLGEIVELGKGRKKIHGQLKRLIAEHLP
jgi:hypothetical protein